MTCMLPFKRIKLALFLTCLLIFGACVIGWLIHGVVATLMLSNLDGWHSEFFPDGTRIVFSVPYNNRKQKGIYVFDREKREAVRLTQPDYRDGFPSVFPDGQTIVFSRGNATNTTLWVMDVDGSNKRALTSPPLFYADYGAFISPNGKYIAFFRKPFADLADLLLLEFETARITRLRRKVNHFAEGCFRWKNDEEIVFLSRTSHSSTISDPSTSLDANIVNVQTGEVRKIVLPDKRRTGAYEDISFSTNQELLILCPNKPYLYQLCIRKLFSEEEPYLLTDEQFNVSNALIHPKGESVLFGTTEFKDGSAYSRTFYFQVWDIKTLAFRRYLFYNFLHGSLRSVLPSL